MGISFVLQALFFSEKNIISTKYNLDNHYRDSAHYGQRLNVVYWISLRNASQPNVLDAQLRSLHTKQIEKIYNLVLVVLRLKIHEIVCVNTSRKCLALLNHNPDVS